jgi:preprotein translocase subunit SecA
MREDALATLLDQSLPRNVPHDDWDIDGLRESVRKDFAVDVDPRSWLAAEPELDEATLRQRVVDAVTAAYSAKSERYGPELMQQVEKDVMLRTLDQHWRDHLAAMDYLRQGIHLRGYAQKDYRYEYKREAYELFSNMLDRVKYDTASVLSRIEIRTEADLQREEQERQDRLLRALQAQHAEAQSLLAAGPPVEPAAAPAPLAASVAAEAATGAGTFVRGERKVGRNEPCPCGSGRKYKQCHGRLEEA